MELDKEAKDWLEETANNSRRPISESSAFISLYTNNVGADAKCALELGLAILMDKPIIVIATKGIKVPKSLLKLADAIEYIDKDRPMDIGAAVKKIVKELNLGQ